MVDRREIREQARRGATTRKHLYPPDGVLNALEAAIASAVEQQGRTNPRLRDSKQVLAALRISPYQRRKWRNTGLANPSTKAGTFVELCAQLDDLVCARVQAQIYARALANAPSPESKGYAASVGDSARMLFRASDRLETEERARLEAAERAERQAALTGRDQVPTDVLDALTPDEMVELTNLQEQAGALTARAQQVIKAAETRMLREKLQKENAEDVGVEDVVD